MQSDSHIAEILQNRDMQQTELVSKLQEDDELQKAAVAALLEKGDARSWSLVQQVRLVENQLAALTVIEMGRKKLEVDDHIVSNCVFHFELYFYTYGFNYKKTL